MKTKLFSIILLATLTMTLLSSCEKINGKGEVITESRTTGTYNAIDLAMSATVYFSPAPEYTLQISGQENVLNQIETIVKGNELVIRVKNNVILGNHEPVTVYVTAPDVSSFDVSGSGDINLGGNLNVTSLTLDVSGSGTINLAELIAAQLTATISGSGRIKATGGAVTREDLHISGSGEIDLRSITAQSVYTTTSGSGDTYVHAVTLLEAIISGSGNIWYYGTPAINTHISGSGNLHRM